MTDIERFSPPKINDQDVFWVSEILGLPPTAFPGSDGLNPRLGVLKSVNTLDIEACPGSGKTTLLVAKLAILARKWSDRCRGVCVLSHTNVARREIEHKLGNTAEGRCLLSYPHFIGTIHGFVNTFLAIPWLRSQSYPVRIIDNDIAQSRRWAKLTFQTKHALGQAHHGSEILRIKNTDFGLGEIRWGKGTLGVTTPTYQELQRACKETIGEGLFCHDEMFVWADDLIHKVPDTIRIIRHRFPFLFIDEVQDNSNAQSNLLYYTFMEGDTPVIRQRYGDANQAIYQYPGQTEDSMTDVFPTEKNDLRRDVPDSFRFTQDIADLADPLALVPQGMKGQRGNVGIIHADTRGKHAVFLFDDSTINKVLDVYGTYLVEVFSEDDLRNGTFTSVGAIHSPPSTTDKPPRFVGHYWPAYDSEITRADPRPKTFIQFVMAGHRVSYTTGDSYPIVQKIAEGILTLVHMASPEIEIINRRRKHRHVLELLDGKDENRTKYINLLRHFATDDIDLTEDQWDDRWSATVLDIAQSICGAKINSDEARGFLSWKKFQGSGDDAPRQVPSDNVFRYPKDAPRVDIQVGSIHSVKGETHTSMLVLDTFYYAHHLKTLKPWLLSTKTGGSKESAANQSRLKLHYVAMTRPSHLLCLAMRDDVFTEGEIGLLKSRGWCVARVRDGYPEWL